MISFISFVYWFIAAAIAVILFVLQRLYWRGQMTRGLFYGLGALGLALTAIYLILGLVSLAQQQSAYAQMQTTPWFWVLRMLQELPWLVLLLAELLSFGFLLGSMKAPGYMSLVVTFDLVRAILLGLILLIGVGAAVSTYGIYASAGLGDMAVLALLSQLVSVALAAGRLVLAALSYAEGRRCLKAAPAMP